VRHRRYRDGLDRHEVCQIADVIHSIGLGRHPAHEASPDASSPEGRADRKR